MLLTLSQAAERLGLSHRQVRYMIQQQRLPARKHGGRWMVDAADLPLSAGQVSAQARRQEALRDAVDQALDPPADKRRWGLRNLKAATILVPLLARCREALGDAHPATPELRGALDQLAMGAHRCCFLGTGSETT